MTFEKKLEQAEYWRLNRRKDSTYTIEYTFYGSGWVRAKLDSLSKWEYKPCKEPRYALQLGELIISQQQRRR